jgi:hypothetical protein
MYASQIAHTQTTEIMARKFSFHADQADDANAEQNHEVALLVWPSIVALLCDI